MPFYSGREWGVRRQKGAIGGRDGLLGSQRENQEVFLLSIFSRHKRGGNFSEESVVQ